MWTNIPDTHPYLNPSNFPEELLCTEEDVFNLIGELDCNKSTGTDDISVNIL
jgi:hypothetical protein